MDVAREAERMQAAAAAVVGAVFPQNLQPLGPGWYKMMVMTGRPLLCIHILLSHKHHHHHNHQKHCVFADKARRGE